MKFKVIILILILLIFNLDLVSAEETEYGIVKAWFNEQNATVETIEGIKLKLGEPAEIRVEVISKIKGDVSFKLYEPGVTKAFKVLNGPSEIEKRIDNMNIESGWSKTYTWTVTPSGDWKNGNAPINIFVQFYKGMKDEKIDFTIANPYILDEQYSGAVPTPGTTASPAGTQAKAEPFIPGIFTVCALILAWRWRRAKT